MTVAFTVYFAFTHACNLHKTPVWYTCHQKTIVHTLLKLFVSYMNSQFSRHGEFGRIYCCCNLLPDSSLDNWV